MISESNNWCTAMTICLFVALSTDVQHWKSAWFFWNLLVSSICSWAFPIIGEKLPGSSSKVWCNGGHIPTHEFVEIDEILSCCFPEILDNISVRKSARTPLVLFFAPVQSLWGQMWVCPVGTNRLICWGFRLDKYGAASPKSVLTID